ncbi:LysR family transcriptional regulator [Roseomonas sp. GC11]|uniref:LysR family transcriptional regulator n=1 Tax=Roseomonas sp. GC11 TaxID=2950546 RepID=UPI002108F9D0|nr:LysR family transcriptional regulator [Roseomonas sp. GC11]MCQ4162680.1 LysR family transcriptional regulator [Roseomonas sp. GC11]
MLHGRMLRYLDEVARAGSIRKAAARLNVASSAINRQILALEEEMGTPLFQRLPRKLVLTAAGEVLLDHVRQTLRGFERAQGQLAELRGLRRGEVSIAVMSGLAATLVALALPRFRQEHPRVVLRVSMLSGPEIMAAVLEGAADFGLGFDLAAEPRLRSTVLADAALGAVMQPYHPLASRSALRLVDCAGYPLVIADRSMAIRPYLEAAFARASLPLDPVLESNSIEVMRRAAALDQGVTFLTPFDILLERRTRELVYVPLAELAGRGQSLRLVCRTRGSSMAAARMEEILGRFLAEELTATG